MKINQKILSIPPYISTAWKNVVSLHIERHPSGTLLVIGLVNGSSIEIPNLDERILQATFAAHERYLEREAMDEAHRKEGNPSALFLPGVPSVESTLMGLPMRFSIDSNMGNLLQHNPQASDSPNLPKDVIEKITSFSKAIGFQMGENFPKPEPHCNCMHCQIMRAMQGVPSPSANVEEIEEVSAEDLRFREWDIHQSDSETYIVINPLNKEEHYDVFLGNPIGCTCGQNNCEHIRAVLNS